MATNLTVLQAKIANEFEVKRTSGGKQVANIRVYFFEKDRSGHTTFHYITVVAWNETAEYASANLSKGTEALITGKLQTQEWTDREGKKRQDTYILASSIQPMVRVEGVGKPTSNKDCYPEITMILEKKRCKTLKEFFKANRMMHERDYQAVTEPVEELPYGNPFADDPE